MITFSHTTTQTFHVVSCASCALPFGIINDLYRRAVTKAEGSIFCPACGKESIWREPEDKKIIRELERKLAWEAEQAASQKRLRDHAEASLIATRGVVTRLQRRVSAGVCPCCNQTFKQLAAHMASQHPQFKDGKSP